MGPAAATTACIGTGRRAFKGGRREGVLGDLRLCAPHPDPGVSKGHTDAQGHQPTTFQKPGPYATPSKPQAPTPPPSQTHTVSVRISVADTGRGDAPISWVTMRHWTFSCPAGP